MSAGVSFPSDPLKVRCITCGVEIDEPCLRSAREPFAWERHYHLVRAQMAAQFQCPKIEVYERLNGGFDRDGWAPYALVSYGGGYVLAVPYHDAVRHGARGRGTVKVFMKHVRGADAVTLLGRVGERAE